MFTIFLRSFLFMGLGLLWGGFVQAQCPPGMYPFHFAPNQPASCAPIPGNGNQQALQTPAPRWERRWGAIATGGALGVATDKLSKQEASQTAMSNCEQQGGAYCKLDAVYDNACAAIVEGEDTSYNVTTRDTADNAVAAGMKTCRAAGHTDCHVYYSACSLPLRIQ